VEEGYPDGLPADYRCPICGAGPDMFERVEL
jgi:rubredoxin